MSPLNVYHLEDSAITRAAVSGMLEQAGYRCVSTEEWVTLGRKILEHTRKGEPVLLITDLDMPGIRGDEFCASLLRYNPGIAIILFSAKALDVLRATADRLGGLKFVPKNDGLPALLHAVEELQAELSRPRAEPGAPREAYLVVPHEREFRRLSQVQQVVGRDKSCDVILVCEGVSRRHFGVRATERGVEVSDLGSRNGVVVDGERVSRARIVHGFAEIVIPGSEKRLAVCLGDRQPGVKFLEAMLESETRAFG